LANFIALIGDQDAASFHVIVLAYGDDHLLVQPIIVPETAIFHGLIDLRLSRLSINDYKLHKLSRFSNAARASHAIKG
jgi:hypothetical protein